MFKSQKLVQLDRKLFGQYPIKFPLEDGIVIIIGPNGGGKTKLLESMRDYFYEQNENVVYFPSYRTLNITYDDYQSAVEKIDSIALANKLGEKKFNLDLVKKWRLSEQDNPTLKWDFEYQYKSYINSGSLQAANFLTKIVNGGENLIVMIDLPEISLDHWKRRSLLEDIFNIPNVMQLIVVTHCPEILGEHRDYAWDIAKLCNINPKDNNEVLPKPIRQP